MSTSIKGHNFLRFDGELYQLHIDLLHIMARIVFYKASNQFERRYTILLRRH